MPRKKKTNRKDGMFVKTFTFNGKRYYVYASTEDEAIEKRAAKKRQLEEGIEEIKHPTLNSYYEHFTEIRRREIKESTIRSQRIQFNNVASVEIATGMNFGDMKINEVTRRDIETVRELLLKKGETPQYINNCMAHVNHVFNSATIDETIQRNPCKALKPLRRIDPPIGENKHRALTEEETEKFFKAATERNSYYLNDFKVMIKTGLRVGELGALYPIDIDTRNGFIHVRRTIQRDEAGTYFVCDDTKTESGSRDIPLTPELISLFREQEQLNRSIFGLKIDRLFRSTEGEILREYSVNREIGRICKAAHIDLFTCHAFRNSFATRFIEQRPGDYKILSDILGHKDISITLNLYTHVMTDKKVAAMNDIKIKTS